MSKFKMSEMTEIDGSVGVHVEGDDALRLEVVHDAKAQSIVMSRYNAARAFGMLAFFLEIKLPSELGKEIKF